MIMQIDWDVEARCGCATGASVCVSASPIAGVRHIIAAIAERRTRWTAGGRRQSREEMCIIPARDPNCTAVAFSFPPPAGFCSEALQARNVDLRRRFRCFDPKTAVTGDSRGLKLWLEMKKCCPLQRSGSSGSA
jgi:hypothetical protein